ncbi:dienelactone hydrolase family protein [Thiomicrospira microaerophila]|uniref:alpha/beta hydrolase n=1 Tax=Thiomicrospira microaerophila TaxID=406020 RepID=UPI00200D86BD|nr:dienelactone hydrolase family protein [Thiomicrospira microaerophila]UQB41978.1 dienelactone hydrolase family protein [Thiomicrospira microaerophila]
MAEDLPIIVEPSIPAKAAVIWLHGLGADGADFVDIVPSLGLAEEQGIRFIFPHAPVQPVTINGGMAMRSWFDIRSMDILNDVDSAGIRVSCHQVYKLIEQQRDLGISSDKIAIAGFSQGGLIALHAGLSYDHPLAGVMALSTWCPLVEQFYLHREMPIFIAHGQQDPVVPFELGAKARDDLTAKGYQVEWQAYPMAHQVCMDEIEAIGAWLRRVLVEAE